MESCTNDAFHIGIPYSSLSVVTMPLWMISRNETKNGKTEAKINKSIRSDCKISGSFCLYLNTLCSSDDFDLHFMLLPCKLTLSLSEEGFKLYSQMLFTFSIQFRFLMLFKLDLDSFVVGVGFDAQHKFKDGNWSCIITKRINTTN